MFGFTFAIKMGGAVMFRLFEVIGINPQRGEPKSDMFLEGLASTCLEVTTASRLDFCPAYGADDSSIWTTRVFV